MFVTESSSVARACDTGYATQADAAAAIPTASENAVRTALEAIQTLGAAGYMREWPVERLLPDAVRHRGGHERIQALCDRSGSHWNRMRLRQPIGLNRGFLSMAPRDFRCWQIIYQPCERAYVSIYMDSIDG
jgi:hypothetical protein